MKSRFRKPQIYTGLDIGTTKICCLIGMKDEDGQSIRILGLGAHPSQGLKNGRVYDIEQTVEAIQKAAHKAKQVAATDIRNVYIGIAGDHIACENAEAAIDVANPERGVSEAERESVVEAAKKISLPPSREAIQFIPQEFVCDTQRGVRDPVNMPCQRLGVRLHIIVASLSAARAIVHCVNQAGLKTNDIVLQSLASSMAVLNDELKDLGCALIDIGGGTTDISVFREGAIRYSGVVPEGGDSITQAVRDGLQVSRYDAENLKKRYGHALAEAVDPEEAIEVVVALKKERVAVKRRYLASLIEAQLTSILARARDQLDAGGLLDNIHAGVVLTGGAALTEGAAALAERIFNKPVTLGAPENLKGMSGPMSSPIYATAVGLLEYGILHGKSLNARPRRLERIKRVITNLFDGY